MLSELKDEQEIMEGMMYMCVYTGTHRIFQIVEKKHVTFFKDPEGQDVEGGRGREREETGTEGTMGQVPQPPGRSEGAQPQVSLVKNWVIRAITGVDFKSN